MTRMLSPLRTTLPDRKASTFRSRLISALWAGLFLYRITDPADGTLRVEIFASWVINSSVMLSLKYS